MSIELKDFELAAELCHPAELTFGTPFPSIDKFLPKISPHPACGSDFHIL